MIDFQTKRTSYSKNIRVPTVVVTVKQYKIKSARGDLLALSVDDSGGGKNSAWLDDQLFILRISKLDTHAIPNAD